MEGIEWSSRTTDVELFTIKKFREALNEDFLLRAGEDQALELKLIAVHELSEFATRAAGLNSTPFAAHFRGPTTPWARQHTYCVTHQRLGQMHIFLVPIGPDGEGMIYEAVFS